MFYWRMVAVFLLVFVGLNSSAWAKDERSPYRGQYAFLKGGVFFPNDRKGSVSSDGLTFENWGLDGFKTGPNIEGGIGSRGDYLGVEIGLGYYDTSFRDANGSIDVSAVPVSFSLIAICPTGPMDLYVGAGPGVYFSDGSVTVAGQKVSASDISFGYHVVAGIDFNVSHDFALGVDAKWFKSEASYSKAGLNINDADIGGIVTRVGLKYRFR